MTKIWRKFLPYHDDDLHRPGAGVVRDFVVNPDVGLVSQFDNGSFVSRAKFNADDVVAFERQLALHQYQPV